MISAGKLNPFIIKNYQNMRFLFFSMKSKQTALLTWICFLTFIISPLKMSLILASWRKSLAIWIRIIIRIRNWLMKWICIPAVCGQLWIFTDCRVRMHISRDLNYQEKYYTVKYPSCSNYLKKSCFIPILTMRNVWRKFWTNWNPGWRWALCPMAIQQRSTEPCPILAREAGTKNLLRVSHSINFCVIHWKIMR